MLPSDDEWWSMVHWITDDQVRVTARSNGPWPTFVGRTNVNPDDLGVESALAESLKSWGEIDMTVNEENLGRELCGFASNDDLDGFIADGLAAAQELANATGQQISYTPFVWRQQTLRPQA